MLKVCIDTNVWISGILFSGPSSKIVDSALEVDFELICSTFILDELKRNLTIKFNIDSKLVNQFIDQSLFGAWKNWDQLLMQALHAICLIFLVIFLRSQQRHSHRQNMSSTLFLF